MDATIELIKEVFARGVNVTEIYIDTIGSPQTYQNKLSRIFPTTAITVAKKADSLYPCVSAASVCAKVTRDAALEVCYRPYRSSPSSSPTEDDAWGSGYPSDARCSTWLRRKMDPIFGWGTECRFSWSTAKDLLEAQAKTASAVRVDWPVSDHDGDGQEESMQITTFFAAGLCASAPSRADVGPEPGLQEDREDLRDWFGTRVSEQVF